MYRVLFRGGRRRIVRYGGGEGVRATGSGELKPVATALARDQ